jgi:hypothetical protein
MQHKWRKVNDTAVLDELIAEITLDAYGDEEQLSAFCQVFEDEVPLPAEGLVIGEPVTIVKIGYDGNARRGLTAKCRCVDGSEHIVAAADVVFPENSTGAAYLAAYHKWLGLKSYPPQASDVRLKRRLTTTSEDFDLNAPLELVVLSIKDRAARCRPLAKDGVVTLRAQRLWDVMPGEIMTIKPSKFWRYGGIRTCPGRWYRSGSI